MSEQAREQPGAPRRKRDPRAVSDEHAPWLPTPWEARDALAMQRLATGTATGPEQKIALKWILTCTGMLDEPYRPGSNDRDTNYALGKASVGRQIVKLAKVNLALIKGEEHGEHS